ncbi:MAG: hypothetical protein ACK5NE_00045 [Brachymonas sp.]
MTSLMTRGSLFDDFFGYSEKLVDLLFWCLACISFLATEKGVATPSFWC